MTRERWTLLLVSDEGANLRQVRFGRLHLRSLVMGAGILCAALVVALGFVGFHAGTAFRSAQLERENRVLESELTAMQARATTLEGSVDQLVELDAELRLLAGLQPIDEEVLRVGVGGPGTPSLEDNPLFSIDQDAAERTFAVAYDLNALERRSRLLVESMSEAADSLSAHRDLLESTPSILPATGMLSSGFSSSRVHPIHNRALPHEGIDITAPRGTPIMAAARGRVVFASRRSGYGLSVELDHGYGYSTLYGHASELLVRPGQTVERGDLIARVGSTGLSTTPHVHYEVRVGDRPVNPMNYVLSGAIP